MKLMHIGKRERVVPPEIKMRVCARCRKGYAGIASLSKRDGRTEICAACSQEEDFIDADMLDVNTREKRFLTILAMRLSDKKEGDDGS